MTVEGQNIEYKSIQKIRSGDSNTFLVNPKIIDHSQK